MDKYKSYINCFAYKKSHACLWIHSTKDILLACVLVLD